MGVRSTRNFGRSSPLSTVSIYRGAQPRGSTGGLDQGLDGRLDRRALPGGSTGGARWKVSDRVVERYNAVLSFHQVENIDECMLLDTEALYICFRTLSDDPHLRRSQASRVRSGEWSQEVHSVRCPVELRSEQTGRHPHSLPSPSFLHHGLGASNVRGSQQYRVLTMPELTQQARALLDGRDPLLRLDVHEGD